MVSVSGVNLLEALVQAELRIMILEKIVQDLINSQPVTARNFNVDMDSLRREALNDLQKKYPDLGIKKAEDNQ